ncbi:unnamed protein product [Calypogeia fissa]
MKLLSGRRSIWLQVLLLVCIASCVATVTAQNGFLSIDCGSDEDYYDNTTGIYWVTDDGYTTTGSNIKNIRVRSSYPIPNKGQVSTLRYFDNPRGRNCYVLPVEVNATYLVRATFFYGNLGNGSDPISFYLYLDNNLITGNQWNPGTLLDYSYDSEVIYAASKSTLDVCLIPYQGPSFISALELRMLAPHMYADAVGPGTLTYLYMQSRVNCGPPENGPVQLWRYPDDTYDRVWQLFGSTDNATLISNRNISGSSSSFAEDPDRPPLVVMQDAWVYYNSNILWVTIPFLSPVGLVYTAAYFQELDGNASATKVRGMTYYLNDNFIENFNSSDEPLEVKTTGILTDSIVNMSFVKQNWSDLKPILNAYELYTMSTLNISTTAAEDVGVITALQGSLNLTDWNADPCLPYPYGWLSCNDDVFPRVINLSLASQGFSGIIPPEISNLTALRFLTLNNNSFNGPIPDLSGLVHLETILLQNNDLSGQIPSFLGTAFPNLTRLNLDYNNLTGQVPSSLNKPGLNFTVLNNPGIVNCTIAACGAVVPPPAPPPSATVKSSSSGTSIGAVVGGIVGGLVVLAVIAAIIWMLCTRKKRATSSIIRAIGNAENQSQQSEFSVQRKALAGSMTLLSLQQVSDATKRFARKIGEGSFGPVYYGKLPDGQEVAVKVRSSDSRQGFQEFLNEVELLSRIHHRNLVSLVGYCEEENQQILIFVYVPNGTLRDHLYADKSRKPLDWRTRLDIALNSARGLEYLHTDCKPRIIHRDVKSSNILLDENIVAKVADFGISKQAPEGVFSGVDTMLKGTPGYFDPEYFISQRLTQKSDVYSFGVVLLEIISGRHPHVSDLPDGSSGTLIQWVRSTEKDGNTMQIVDPTLKEEFNEESMLKVVSLAISCIALATAKRPDMGQVVRALTEAHELELYSEVKVKPDQGSHTTILEGRNEGKEDGDDYNLDSLPNTGVLEVDPESIVLPR